MSVLAHPRTTAQTHPRTRCLPQYAALFFDPVPVVAQPRPNRVFVTFNRACFRFLHTPAQLLHQSSDVVGVIAYLKRALDELLNPALRSAFCLKPVGNRAAFQQPHQLAQLRRAQLGWTPLACFRCNARTLPLFNWCCHWLTVASLTPSCRAMAACDSLPAFSNFAPSSLVPSFVLASIVSAANSSAKLKRFLFLSIIRLE